MRARLPITLRPSFIIRRNAIRQGILGPSVFWKVVAVGVFGRRTMKKVFGKQPEPLGNWTVGTNTVLGVIAAAPMTKAQRKASGLSTKQRRDIIVAQAVADTRAKNPDAKIVVKTK